MARFKRDLGVAEDMANGSLVTRTNELIRRDLAHDAEEWSQDHDGRVVAAIKLKADTFRRHTTTTG